MSKQTFTFTLNGKTYIKNSVKVYTHVVLWKKDGKEGLFGWHTSEKLAQKQINNLRTCVGRDFYKDHEFTVAEVV